MKVLVCGSIGYGGIEEIRRLQRFLRERGYDVLDQLVVDYSDVDDFRGKPELWDEIVKRDLEFCRKADVIVLIATNPSFGAMAEVVISAMKGKPIVAFCPKEVKSPWPLYFSTSIARNEEELLKFLESVKSIRIRTIPNVYGRHEAEFTYSDFTCICPVTGRRDYAKIRIRYRPRNRLIEYESLDEYFKSFRDRAMHHEAVVEKIFNDLIEVLNPEWLEVVAEFEERSGVRAVVRRTTPSHDYGHVERVRRMAVYIAEKEGADLKVVEKAAELHDVARDMPNHAVESAKVAERILRDEGFDEEFIAKVVHCIEAHSFSSGVEPKTMEAKVLSDADKLDAMGAIGVARAFMFSGERGRSIEETLKHFEDKLLKLKDLMFTETAKKIAEERHEFMLEFYRRLKKELEEP